MTNIIKQDTIKKKIFLIREQSVMLDSSLAELYGVETKVLNQAVKRNHKRFPEDFMFQLTKEEFLRCQNVASSLRSQIVTLKTGRGRHRKYLPYAFTEQGVAMLSSVLNSNRAIQVNIAIMRVFVNVRKIVSANREMLIKLDKLESRVESHDKETKKEIKNIFEVIHKQTETKLLSPDKPFSNKKVIKGIISSCEEYIYWVDKYFSKAGLDWLYESFRADKVKEIKILMLSDKVNKKFVSLYKDLKKELKSNKVKFEIKGIVDKKVSSAFHDRWIISKGLCYNVPSTDIVARGQYAEVKKTNNIPPFDKWWRKSRGIDKI
jgi:hypothetical protein